MTTKNFDIFQLAIRESDDPDRAEIERDFTEVYQRTIANSGLVTAEALARSAALSAFLRLDADAVAYLRPHLA